MSFQKLINDFFKKEYELNKRRTTKLAKWAFLTKNKKWSFGKDAAFIYYVDGDIVLSHMNDFIRRLIEYYDNGDLDNKDQAVLIHTGDINSREFRKLAKNSMDDGAYKIIKIRKLLSTSLKSEKSTKNDTISSEKVMQKEFTNDVSVNVNEVKREIRKWRKVAPRVTGKSKEKKMTLSLVGYLAATFPEIVQEHKLGKTRIDAVIEGIGIEAKYEPSQNEINRLFGQVDDYLRYLDFVIVVFFNSEQSMVNNFERKLKSGGYDKSVSIITI